MKLRQWLYGATALAMLASCSDHDVAPNSGADEGGDGYIGIKIQLPTVRPTRANDNFDDGVGSEYEINDAILLLFQGADQSSATCTGAFTLKNSDPVKDTESTQITSYSTRVANVSGIKAGNKVYALVMINGNNKGIYTNNEPEQTWMKGKTIKEYQEWTITDTLYNQAKAGVGYASGIFMTNSPLSEKRGGPDNPDVISDALPVLVELNAGAIYPTEKQALENPAGVIHVERAVAKITCSKFNTVKAGEGNENGPQFFTLKVNGSDYQLEPQTISWDMAQSMAETYIVRNTNRTPVKAEQGTGNMWAWNYSSAIAGVADYKYRMLGHDEITVGEGDDAKKYYRPYFCQVPGYNVPDGDSGIKEQKNFNKKEMTADKAVAWSAAAAFYPRENTFPVKYMKYANTTRIGFWVTFKFTPISDGAAAIESGKDFYINGADKSTIYLNDKFGNDPLTNHAIAELSKNPAVVAAVNNALDTSKEGSFDMDNLSDLLKFTYDEVSYKDGRVFITDISFKTHAEIDGMDKYHAVFASAPEFVFSSLINGFNNYGQFYKYSGGKVFYEVRIKHFGDDLTPWALENNTAAAATTIDESYGTGSAVSSNYLGRYGIVRNNWYDLQVNDIKKLGYPEDPARWDDTWPGKPDDNRDQYIAVELKVLSWAKRTQTHTF